MFNKNIKKTVRIISTVLLGLIIIVGAVSTLLLFPTNKVIAAPNIPMPSSPNQSIAMGRAIKGMVTQFQNTDGGYGQTYGSTKGASKASSTADAVLAFAAANYDPNRPFPGQTNSPIGWMRRNPITVANFAAKSGGAAGKIVLALKAANQNPRNFQGYNFVISITNQLSTTGQYRDRDGISSFRQAQAILGLKAASSTIPTIATNWLTSQQSITGSWDVSFAFNYAPNGTVDSTGMVMMALVASGLPVTHPAIIRATDFLSRYQKSTGGFESNPDGSFASENAASTAFAYQALLAIRENVGMSSRWDKGMGKTPMSAILKTQDITTGAFIAFGSLNDNTTRQVIPAIARKMFPFKMWGAGFPTLNPLVGGIITGGRFISMTFPTGAVSNTTIITVSTGITSVRPITGFRMARRAFIIDAMDSDNNPVTRFNRPFTLTFTYEDTDWQNSGIISETNLNLYFWDVTLNKWMALLPCEGCIHDTVNNRFIVRLDHLTEFALLESTAVTTDIKTYLPIVINKK